MRETDTGVASCITVLRMWIFVSVCVCPLTGDLCLSLVGRIILCICPLIGDLCSSLVDGVIQCVCPLTGDLCSSLVGRAVLCICPLTGDLCSSLVGRAVLCMGCNIYTHHATQLSQQNNTLYNVVRDNAFHRSCDQAPLSMTYVMPLCFVFSCMDIYSQKVWWKIKFGSLRMQQSTNRQI